MPQQSRYRTGDQALVRQMNLSVIMHHLRESAPVSRAALAEITGLNKTTVSSLVQELIEQHYVEEFGLNSAGAGRPAVLLRLNPTAGCIVAAEISVDFISVIRTDFAAEITWRHRESIRRDMGQFATIDRTLALLLQATELDCSANGPLLGIAVGVPGLVDQEDGTVLFAPNLGWHDVPLRELIQARFQAPVLADNEANLAALGEYYFGAAQGFDEVLYLSAGIGLGGGILHGGQLYRGHSGFSGEVGHMTMDPDGEPCACGNRGCWETQVSQGAVFRNVRRAVAQGHASRLPTMAGRNLEALTLPMILDAARSGDTAAIMALGNVGRDLGIGIASLANALNPSLVVLGGMLSAAGQFLLPAAETELHSRALRWNAAAMRVVPARHGSDACVMGGVAAVLQTAVHDVAPEAAARASLGAERHGVSLASRDRYAARRGEVASPRGAQAAG